MSNVTIVDAQKTTDHVGASNFIVYVIRSGVSLKIPSTALPGLTDRSSSHCIHQNDEAKRRYSEFEALRSALVQLHPTLIIPPIPSKHTLSDYAVKQSKAKEDATIIARRKRMLQSFLRRCASHPDLQNSDVLKKFLDGRWSWVSKTIWLSLASPSMLTCPAYSSLSTKSPPARRSHGFPNQTSRRLLLIQPTPRPLLLTALFLFPPLLPPNCAIRISAI